MNSGNRPTLVNTQSRQRLWSSSNESVCSCRQIFIVGRHPFPVADACRPRPYGTT